jgi:hypothetical protein
MEINRPGALIKGNEKETPALEARAGAKRMIVESKCRHTVDRPGSRLWFVASSTRTTEAALVRSLCPREGRSWDVSIGPKPPARARSAPTYFFFGAAFFGAAFVGAALAGAALGLASGFDGLLFLAGSDFFTAIVLTSFQDILACVRPA